MPRSKRTKTTAPAPETPSTNGDGNPWAELGLGRELVAALADAKFLTPTDIQRELIPHALAGRDCLGQAKTGTGKTASFALPLIDMITPGQPAQALILVPTRELAVQVGEHFRMLSTQHPLKTALLYGGKRVNQQISALKRDPEIIVGTPGRIQDLLRRRDLNFDNIRFVVLDEVDRMLDIGFRDDIRRILKKIETEHQTIFVSATIDDEIRKLARTYMREPVELNVSADRLTVENVEHGYVPVNPHDKFATLLNMLEHEKPALAIVFTNTKHAARRVAERLKAKGINCKDIHGDLMQSRRDRVMKSFRSAKIHVLVATDLASRGLDVMEVSHIINYDIPEDPSVYVHRIGRTARMGQRGYAVTFVEQDEGKFLTEVEKLINQELPRFEPSWLIKRLPAETVAPEPEEPSEDKSAPERYREALRRCRVLEKHGYKPQPRTLGSRFRSARKRR